MKKGQQQAASQTKKTKSVFIARVMVVVNENPSGRMYMNRSSAFFLIALRPEFRSGIHDEASAIVNRCASKPG